MVLYIVFKDFVHRLFRSILEFAAYELWILTLEFYAAPNPKSALSSTSNVSVYPCPSREHPLQVPNLLPHLASTGLLCPQSPRVLCLWVPEKPVELPAGALSAGVHAMYFHG